MSRRVSDTMSSIPCSCIQVESTVIPVPLASVWPKFREFKLDTVAPTYVKTTEGKSEGIGSVVKVHYADGTIWEIRVTEVSERNHTIAYEVISSEPAMTYTAAEGELSFDKVTDGDQTFLCWTTIFSNDADAQIIQDQKYKKLEFFADFKKTMSV